MKTARTRTNQPGTLPTAKATALSLGFAALASTAGAAELSLDEIRAEVFAAHILTPEQREKLPRASQGALAFEGLSGITYELWVVGNGGQWEHVDSARCENGVGEFARQISTADGPRYQILPAQSDDEVAPRWPRRNCLDLVSAESGTITLSWRPAHDNEGVVAYALCENGEHIATLEGADGGRVQMSALERGHTVNVTLVAFDAAGNGTQLPCGLTIQSYMPSATQNVGTTGHSLGGKVAARKRIDKSSPLIAARFGGEDLGGREPVFGGEDIGEVSPGQVNPLDVIRALVGVPPGVGLTFKALAVANARSTPFVPSEVTDALAARDETSGQLRRSLVGVPPGVGLTFRSSVWDDADIVHVSQPGNRRGILIHELGHVLGYTATDDPWHWGKLRSITSLPVGGDVMIGVRMLGGQEGEE